MAAFHGRKVLVHVFLLVLRRHSSRLGLHELLPFKLNGSFGLSEADPRLQPADHLKPFRFVKVIRFRREEISTGKQFTLHGERDPNGGIRADRLAMKLSRRDSDDFVRRSQNANLAAQDVPRAAKPILPEAVADHGYRIRIAKLVHFRAEGSAENGSNAER